MDADEAEANMATRADELVVITSIYGDILLEQNTSNDGTQAAGDRLAFDVPVDVEGQDPWLELAASLAPGLLCRPATEEETARGVRSLPLLGLPPLSLSVRFPLSYPSRSPPILCLRCSWLSDAELQRLIDELGGLWRPSEPMMCEAICWLRTDALAALPPYVLQPLRLPGDSHAQRGERAGRATDARASRWPRRAPEVLALLLAASGKAEEALWRDSVHACGVCLEEQSSVDCVRLVRCRHTFCKGCLSSYFTSQLSDGQAAALLCPEPSCRVSATPSEVKLLLPDHAFEKYERLLLSLSLAEMDDVVWCPRGGCDYPAIKHDGAGGQLASCGKCGFSFCCDCKQAWHGVSPCADLIHRWRNADESTRAVMSDKYGAKLVEELESSEWIASNTKACPRCRAATEKNGGCNHISCHKCSHEWCWLCSSTYQQGHFKQGTCEQFSQDFFDEIDMTPDAFHRNFGALNHW